MITVERLDDAAIVRVTGDLDGASAPTLGSMLEFAQKAKVKRIVVSLEGCDFCDASGLSVLLEAHKAAASAFTVVVPERGKCRRVFEVTGVCKILRLVSTMQHALGAQLPVAV